MTILLVAALLTGSLVTLDGDTIIADGTRIRIANIDAPEIHRFHCDAERRLGLVAKRRVAELLASGQVTVHPGDPDSGRLTDRYGRTLATIEVNGRDVGEILIAEGLARPWNGKRRPWCD
ncbi:thermonuclease family protein [Mesorhizobium muleiense]|uniref:thermonuclease family protein n=1 Tax=Mesorhizobium muleiense TaxID=1004279 RepID=UPI000FE86DCE|nr:thermonuclease family protein [Mesorhizobium muleiense]MCF6112290.1 thermonuclease family protein [Mesorhizobium muleiense]RWB96513.1 MAG: thermonuclease family protein [Mesorhizobium sp.]